MELLPFHGEHQVQSILDRVLGDPEAPLAVGVSLAFQWRATETLALVMALREGGYHGHITRRRTFCHVRVQGADGGLPGAHG